MDPVLLRIEYGTRDRRVLYRIPELNVPASANDTASGFKDYPAALGMDKSGIGDFALPLQAYSREMIAKRLLL